MQNWEFPIVECFGQNILILGGGVGKKNKAELNQILFLKCISVGETRGRLVCFSRFQNLIVISLSTVSTLGFIVHVGKKIHLLHVWLAIGLVCS